MFYFACCMNIIFNSLLAHLVKYDVHTTRKIKQTRHLLSHIIIIHYCLSLMLCVAYLIQALTLARRRRQPQGRCHGDTVRAATVN